MCVRAGARFTEPAARQYGTRRQHEPRFLSDGPGRADHDRQQLGPVPQQVGFLRPRSPRSGAPTS